MNSENELIQKLMMSKKIMDIHSKTPRNQTSGMNINMPVVEEFSTPQASYNIPQDVLTEVNQSPIPKKMNQEVPTEQRIMSSKLPDEIKRLMIEHPIAQPNSMSGPTLSNELVEKASRLMGTTPIQENNQQQRRQTSNPNVNLDDIRSVVRETVEEVLKENGLLLESTSKSSETITFKVGKHVFEGKVTKIKKLQ
jgi:hypothetical protein